MARQIVVLGAGLDTFAYRLDGKDGLRVFEVDHPATQAEKRRRLPAASIAPPAHLIFAFCDFEHAELGNSLRAVGFNPNRRAFFLWLGVVPYLTEKAIFATLGFIAKLPGGEVVFDYANPVETIADPASRELHERLSQRVAGGGRGLSQAISKRPCCMKNCGRSDLARSRTSARTGSPRGIFPNARRQGGPAGGMWCARGGERGSRRGIRLGRRKVDASRDLIASS